PVADRVGRVDAGVDVVRRSFQELVDVALLDAAALGLAAEREGQLVRALPVAGQNGLRLVLVSRAGGGEQGRGRGDGGQGQQLEVSSHGAQGYRSLRLNGG